MMSRWLNFGVLRFFTTLCCCAFFQEESSPSQAQLRPYPTARCPSLAGCCTSKKIKDQFSGIKDQLSAMYSSMLQKYFSRFLNYRMENTSSSELSSTSLTAERACEMKRWYLYFKFYLVPDTLWEDCSFVFVVVFVIFLLEAIIDKLTASFVSDRNSRRSLTLRHPTAASSSTVIRL